MSEEPPIKPHKVCDLNLVPRPPLERGHSNCECTQTSLERERDNEQEVSIEDECTLHVRFCTADLLSSLAAGGKRLVLVAGE